MAIFTIIHNPLASGQAGYVTAYNSTQITIQAGTVTQNYLGYGFTYNQFAQVTGGILTSTNIYDSANGGLQYEITGLSVSAAVAYSYVASGNGYGLSQFLLSGADTIYGSAENDILDGAWGADVIYGGVGNDTLVGSTDAFVDTLQGGAGDDTYDIGGGDIVVEATGEGTDTVIVSGDYTLQDNFENLSYGGYNGWVGSGNALGNLITGGNGANMLSGNGGDDTLQGGYYSDTLAGGSGDNVLRGMAGDDLYISDSAGDTYVDTDGYDTVRASYSGHVLASGIERLVLTGSALTGSGNLEDNRLTGNELDNTLSGFGGGDLLEGLSGADLLDGGDGADTLYGGDGTDSLLGGAGADLLDGGAGADWLDGGDDADTLYGGDGADTLSGGIGADSIDGGSGADLLHGGAGADWLDGGDDADTLTGGEGADTLNGGLGADMQTGGIGDDVYFWENVGDTAIELGNEGIDTVRSSRANATLSANIENLTLLGTADINGTGNNLANVITGNAGKNIIDGGTGADTMYGGLGDDTYHVDNTGDRIVDTGADIDTVWSSVSFDMVNAVGVANLTLQGNANLNAWGNELLNVITGNAGNNILTAQGADSLFGGAGNDTLLGSSDSDHLDGGTGADVMSGGLGADFYTVDNVGDVINEVVGQSSEDPYDTINAWVSYTLPNLVEYLILKGNAGLSAWSDGRGSLTGNSGANLLTGGREMYGMDGDDTLVGATDYKSVWFVGGAGDDTYVIQDYFARVSEDTNAGIDTVLANYYDEITLATNVENLTLLQGGSGIGNSLNNVIIGAAGDDYLDGGIGADTLRGGQGDDNYIVDNAGDVVIELAGGGIDTIYVKSGASFSLEGTQVERLNLSAPPYQLPMANSNGTGNALDNWIMGTSGNNILDGGAGADELHGGLGNDTLIGGAGFDTATYSGMQSDYTITRTATGFIVTGGQGTDVLSGIERLTFSYSSVILKPVADDFDGDGRSDVLWRNSVSGANVIWHSANSATTSRPQAQADLGWKIVATGDFQGDGKADILWSRADGGLSEIWLNGDSNMLRIRAPESGAGWTVAGVGNFGIYAFDGSNGMADILWTNTLTGENVIWSDGVYGTEQVATLADLNWKVAGIGDFNGDRTSDILWRNGATGANMIWRSAQSASETALAQASQDWKVVGVADFDGNGTSDILWRNAATGANTIWKSGNAATQQTVNTLSDGNWRVAGTGDYDGDGKADILWRNGLTGAGMIWSGGNGALIQAVATVGDAAWQVAPVAGAVAGTATLDFDGDGKSDILWRNSSTGADQIWKSGSSASVQAVNSVTTGWAVAGIDDFDGDGKADILWRNTSTGANTIWKSGNGATTQSVATMADQAWKVVGSGDYDGDGKADILWRNISTGADQIWKSGNSTTVQAVTSVSTAWSVAGSGDFNGDGKDDILWRNSSTGANTIWKSGNNATVQAVNLVNPADWTIVGTGDYDGDGKADIVWRNLATGADQIWKSGNGASVLAVTTLDPDWSAVDGLESGDLLRGGAGNNTLMGTLNADLIFGGAGADTLTGGLGNDLFRYLNPGQGNDTITDFTLGADKLQIVGSGFGGFAAGVLAGSAFVSGAAPVASSAFAQFLYNTGSGQLSFDADGSGAGAAVNIAVLIGHPALGSADFVIV